MKMMRHEEFRHEKAIQLKRWQHVSKSSFYENVFRGLRKSFIFCFILVSAVIGRVCQDYLNSSTYTMCGL